MKQLLNSTLDLTSFKLKVKRRSINITILKIPQSYLTNEILYENTL